MKGLINIIEVMITGIILLLAFLHFFPRYLVKSEWNNVLLTIKVKDSIQTIDNLNKTFIFAKDSSEFDDFMGDVFLPEYTGAVIWWKEINQVDGDNFMSEQGITNTQIPYFTEGYKETIVDVVNTTSGYHVYSFTLGLGYPY
jgi:hypothetical protein